MDARLDFNGNEVVQKFVVFTDAERAALELTERGTRTSSARTKAATTSQASGDEVEMSSGPD